MFRYDANRPSDIRMAYLDLQDTDGRRVSRLARRAANAERQCVDVAKHRNALRSRMESLGTTDLNHLAVMYLIDLRFSGATGEGAVWAVASRICNELARELLRERPMFEIQ